MTALQEPQASVDYHRVARALRFLAEERRRQPSLEEVAEHVGLSPFHFQRLFQRWAGVSPKRFLQFLTREHARELLARRRPVIEVAAATGLTSGSRLHTLFVSTEGVTPGELRERGRDLTIAWGVHDSPFGPCLLAATGRGVCGMAFLERAGDAEEELERILRAYPAARRRADAARTAPLARRAFAAPAPDLPLVLRGSPFQLRVWQALLETPPGAVTTYGDLAARSGDPRAARAIGGAVGRNVLAYLIPCHRVIRAVGETGGYRWGPERKRAMLGWEAARARE